MKNISKILAITSLLSFNLAYCPIAHSRNSDRPEISLPTSSIQLAQSEAECDRALVSVQQTIGQNRDIPVTFRGRDIPDGVWQEGRPADANTMLQVLMTLKGPYRRGNGYQISNVMNSPQFLNSLATQIINACGIQLVAVGIYGSDVIDYYGLVNGTVQPFQCIPDRRYGVRSTGGSETWGFVYC